MTAPTVRLARATDLEPLRALVESAYRGEASRAGWTTEADLLDGQRTDAAMLRDLIADEATVILLMEDAAGLLACCQLEHRGATTYFGMFAVRPGDQGRGTGRQMLAAAERHARTSWGATALEMTVIAQRSELIAWYQRRGYRPTGETRAFPYGRDEFGLPRRTDLVLAVLAKPLAGEGAVSGPRP